MDSLISAAARALSAGDPVGALARISLREDPPALALRGIAMAQLGEFPRARELLRMAARRFGSEEPLASARCILAEAEVALVSRDLGSPEQLLENALATLEEHGDRVNAAHARLLKSRGLLLVGRLAEAERTLLELEPCSLPPAGRTAHELVHAGIAIRRLRVAEARAALDRAGRSALEAGIPALRAEVHSALLSLDSPAARRLSAGTDRLLTLAQVEKLLTRQDLLVVDACRLAVRAAGEERMLSKRPVLFTLLRCLAEAWPEGASRLSLVERAFRAKDADESHRARLRVEIGRLRGLLAGLAGIVATKDGFALAPSSGWQATVLAPPEEGAHAALLALLGDGEAWSSSALATALGASARTVQRALESLALDRKVQPLGNGRARRWVTRSLPGFPTTLLLPGSFASA